MMRFLTDGEIILAEWATRGVCGFAGGIVGVVFDMLFYTTPAGVVVGVSGAIIGETLMFWEWRHLIALKQSQAEARFTPTPETPEGYIPINREYQSETVNHWAKLDLVRACGDIDAVNNFRVEVWKRGELRVEYWKAFRGVGREMFVKMRTELVRCQLVDNNGFKGAYQWTDEGRRWLASLPHITR